AFVKAFTDKYGAPPSQAAQTVYVQTLLYSDAVERAGSFYPPDVIKALEDHKVTGIGPGEVLYRGCDHQAFHDVVVVQGKKPANRKNEYDLFDIVEQVPRDTIVYECDYFTGELGPYKPA